MASLERQVAEAMAAAHFGVYRVLDWHPVAGLWIEERGGGDKDWLVDRSLEDSAVPGMHLALRVFRPETFLMSTGLAMLVDDRVLAAAGATVEGPTAIPPAETFLKAVLTSSRR